MKITTKKILGAVLIILGLILHLIPLFPAGWIIVVGLELLGIRLLLQDKIANSKIYQKIKNYILKK
ncbi:MAG: hypothetical protein WCV55_03685 [Candidatus Paceibacterota bacterium]